MLYVKRCVSEYASDKKDRWLETEKEFPNGSMDSTLGRNAVDHIVALYRKQRIGTDEAMRMLSNAYYDGTFREW